jgi:autophagy-related protein 11
MKIYRTYDGRSFDISQPLTHFQSKDDLFDAISLTAGIPSDDIICMTQAGQQINEDVLEEMQESSLKAGGDNLVSLFVALWMYSND